MSFLKKLFGGDDSPRRKPRTIAPPKPTPTPPPAPPAPPARTAPAAPPPIPENTLSSADEARRLVGQFIVEARTVENPYDYDTFKEWPRGQELVGAKPAQARLLVLALIERALPLLQGDIENEHEDQWRILTALDHLGRRKLPYEDDDILALILIDHHRIGRWGTSSTLGLIASEHRAKKEPLPEALYEALLGWREAMLETGDRSENRKILARATDLLGLVPHCPIPRGEAWAELAVPSIEAMPPADAAAWNALLQFALGVDGGKPTKKFEKAAAALLEAVGHASFEAEMLRWFPEVDKRPPVELAQESQWDRDPNVTLDDRSSNILKGLVWMTTLLEGERPDLARAVGALGLSAYRKVPGIGPRAVKLGNACVYALGRFEGLSAVGQLSFLRMRVKYKPAQKGIAKSLEAAAERMGMTADDLEEIGVPTYDLTDVGIGEHPMGSFVALLEVPSVRTVQLRWRTEKGKIQKTVPKAIKEEHAEELKDLKSSMKDLKAMLPAQRDRIDAMYLAQRSWSHADWQARYADHPLVGVIARRLLWRFTTGDETHVGIHLNGAWVGHDDAPLPSPTDESRVELWHPLGEPEAEVTAWRDWLMRHEVTQPFKQAYREVYVLTDAERNTRVYSNRYAAHVLKQHQMNALCAARGWRAQTRLMVDDYAAAPHKELPGWDLRAEFWVEGVGDEYGVDTTEAGSFLRIASDQVRFQRLEDRVSESHACGGDYTGWHGAGEPVPLEDVPPLVFSEIMRDVDLFVGVASLGADPTWADGGEDGRHREYWVQYAWGELSEASKTRRDILQGLVPQLDIADRCAFDGNYLVVRGDVRTYKIHMGSGNILMEPNDQYLCIVPANAHVTRTRGKVFLPFDGDRTLSLILSKAFLLAADTKIKDETILSQIGRR